MKKYRLVFVKILTSTTITDVDPVHCEPNENVLMIVSNEDPANNTYVFSLDPGTIVLKQDLPTKKFSNPFVSPNKASLTLDPGEADMIRIRVKPKGNFGSGAGKIPYTTHKYTLVLTDQGSGNFVEFDPDFDVSPPN